MPQVVTVKVHNGRGRRVRLWIPLLPVLVVLSPLVLLVLIGSVVACLANRIPPGRALETGWRVLCATRGTQVRFEQGRTAVLITPTLVYSN